MSLSGGLIPLGGKGKAGGGSSLNDLGGLIPVPGSRGSGSKAAKASSDFDFDRDQLSPSDKEDGGDFSSALDDMLDRPLPSKCKLAL